MKEMFQVLTFAFVYSGGFLHHAYGIVPGLFLNFVGLLCFYRYTREVEIEALMDLTEELKNGK